MLTLKYAITIVYHLKLNKHRGLKVFLLSKKIQKEGRMVFLSVLLGVGVDYFIDYLFLPARRNKPMFGPFDNW